MQASRFASMDTQERSQDGKLKKKEKRKAKVPAAENPNIIPLGGGGNMLGDDEPQRKLQRLEDE